MSRARERCVPAARLVIDGAWMSSNGKIAAGDYTRPVGSAPEISRRGARFTARRILRLGAKYTCPRTTLRGVSSRTFCSSSSTASWRRCGLHDATAARSREQQRARAGRCGKWARQPMVAPRGPHRQRRRTTAIVDISPPEGWLTYRLKKANWVGYRKQRAEVQGISIRRNPNDF